MNLGAEPMILTVSAPSAVAYLHMSSSTSPSSTNQPTTASPSYRLIAPSRSAARCACTQASCGYGSGSLLSLSRQTRLAFHPLHDFE